MTWNILPRRRSIIGFGLLHHPFVGWNPSVCLEEHCCAPCLVRADPELRWFSKKKLFPPTRLIRPPEGTRIVCDWEYELVTCFRNQNLFFFASNLRARIYNAPFLPSFSTSATTKCLPVRCFSRMQRKTNEDAPKDLSTKLRKSWTFFRRTRMMFNHWSKRNYWSTNCSGVARQIGQNIRLAANRAGHLNVREQEVRKRRELTGVESPEMGQTTETVTHYAWRMKVCFSETQVLSAADPEPLTWDPCSCMSEHTHKAVRMVFSRPAIGL